MQTNPFCGIYSGIFSLLLEHVEDVCSSTKAAHSWKSTLPWALMTSSLCLFILLSVILNKKEHKHAVCLSAHTSSQPNSNCRWLTFKSAAPEGNSLWDAKRWRPKGRAVLMSVAAAVAARQASSPNLTCTTTREDASTATVARVERCLTFGAPSSHCVAPQDQLLMLTSGVGFK